MRILHFSDIHYENSFEQDRVIDSFCKDLKHISGECSIDVILFTGDLASKGDTGIDSIASIKTNVIDKVRRSIDASVPIVVCPGNHDINLGARRKLFDAIFDRMTSPGDANPLVEQPVDDENRGVWGHLAGYHDVARYIDPEAYAHSHLFYTKVVVCEGRRVGIASLNSAWNCKGGGNADYGKLLIGERQVDLALREIADCEIRLAILHHSDNWLVPSEKPLVQRLLLSNFHGVFYGHNHETNASALASNTGAAFFSNTGCIYHSREYFNGYSIVDCDFLGGGWSVSAREYYHQRNEFDIAPRFAKNGVSQFSLTTSTNSLIVITGGVINAIQDRANSKLLSYSASEVAPKQMGAIFVEPPMAEQSENLFVANEAAVGGQSRLLAVNQLYSSGSLLLIMGKREAGKTILLHELAVNRLRDFGCDVRLGLVVDLSTIPRLTESAILDRAAEFLGNEMRRREIVKLLEAGEVLLCLDNLHLHKTAQVELVRAVVAKFKKSRFVVSANEETVDDLSIEAIPSLGIPVRRVYIHSFRRKQTKELVRKWFGDTDAASAKKLEIVTQLFERLNVPRTPFIISVLLWVIEQKPSSVLINQAAAIEVLIEGLLEKFKESKARVEFDSNVQQHFLEELSAHLDAQSVEWMTSFHFDEFVIFYFKKKGLQVSTRGFAEELIRKGLVYESGDRVAFKFDCFRAYFLARRFAKDSDLWRKALSKENVHRYVAELDLFTGLHRDRADVLEAAATVCSTLFLSADCDVELTNIQDLGKDAFPLDDERIVSLQNEVLTDGTRIHEDYLSRTDIPTKVSMDHNEGRKRRSILSSSPQIRFMESLRVLSIVLRNSELVDDVELKRKCFGSALKYWAQAMLSGLMAARIENLRLEIESMPQELQAIGAEKISFLMRTIFPTVIQTMLSETLTTPKLQLFVSERVEDSVVVIRMFAIFLALDNRHSGSLKMVRGFLKDNRKNTMVAQSVFFKLLSIYMHRAAERLNVVELRECLADAFSALRGAGLKENSVLKAQFLQSLDKKMTSDTSIGG